MIFKKIELFGFKSFADRQEIKFDGGITAIVGPNGCGKSNIADAIRWVQGEQSSKLLRGSSMQDVIFNGTEKRRSLGFCEVSIFFDNTSRIIPMDYNEVVITRKLFRSGESEYLINREECRLKDIVTILRDLGISKEGYSIIGQGQVDKIISSKPEDRRAIFEEAAGISKHKAIKLESERKLERTKENLDRITDIRAEIERQYNPMQKQAENAKLYLALKETLKHYEVNSYIDQFEKASFRKAEIDGRIKNADDEIALRRKQMDGANKDYANVLRDLNEADYDQKRYTDEILSLTVLLEKTMGETKLVEERLNFMREQKRKLETDIGNLSTMQAFATSQQKDKKEAVEKKRSEIEGLEEKSKIISENYLCVISELTEGENDVESGQRAMLESLNNLSDIKANEARLDAELKILKEREIDLKNEIASFSSAAEGQNAARKQVEEAASKLAAQVKQGENKLNVYMAEMAQLNAASAQLEESLSKNKARLVSAQSRHKMLGDLQADNEGYAFSVRKLLERGNVDPGIKALFIGTVAQLFKTQEKYEIAIEMALAANVQNVVTTNEENAKKIIEFLKQNRLGRATMLPLTSVKPRTIDERLKSTINRAGAIVATQAIYFDAKYSRIFEMLLGGTVICDNIDKAISLAKETGYAFKIVTLDGEVVATQGSISGGSRKNEGTSIITRAREIETLEKEIFSLFERVEKEESEKKKLLLRREEIVKCGDEEGRLLTDLKIERSKKEQEIAAFINDAARHEDNKAHLKRELETNVGYQSSIEKDMQALKLARARVEGEKTDADSRVAKRQKQFDDLKKQKDIYNENMTEVKVKISALESEVAMLMLDSSRLENEREQMAESLEQSTEQLKKIEREILACSQISFDLKDEGTKNKSADRLVLLKSKVESIGSAKAQKQAQLGTIEEERQRLTQDMNRLQEKKMNEEVALSRVDTDIEFMEKRVFDEYELTYETALNYKQQDYDFGVGEKEIGRIKREIYKLGSVNVNAIEDVRELETRLIEYRTQETDLIKAQTDLLKIIKDLTAEMTDKFSREFAVIAANFTRVFKELFGGGNAKLILQENPGEPLGEGIEIVAEPPGKKLQSITLLSGGEKALTAIAILFAILRARPMPFCVLDEIEAALDEANVTRFAQYLRRFASGSQFIVITHRKPSMEEADVLYGVTMEEKGVSKLVSVTLAEAKKA